MKIKRKILVDRLIGTPLAYLVNLCARLLGVLLRIDHRLDADFETIVICKYAGLGSIIQATPLIQTLQKKYPQARFIFVTTQANAALISHLPGIHEALLVSDKNLWQVLRSSLRLLIRLWRLRPGLYIDLEFYSNYSGIMTTLSKAKNRLGFYNADKKYRQGIYNYLVPFDPESPIAETYLQFADLLHCREKMTDLKISAQLPQQVLEPAKKLGLTPDKKYIVINPNASDLRLERRWPKGAYISSIQHLLHHFSNYAVVLIGSKVEADYVQEIMSEIAPNANLINSAGRLTLSELIALIAGAHLMLTNDTGPMHMAFALGTKTIALFGPCSPQQYGKLSNGIILYKKVACSPCIHRHLIPPCRGNNICMKQISDSEVQAAFAQCLV